MSRPVQYNASASVLQFLGDTATGPSWSTTAFTIRVRRWRDEKARVRPEQTGRRRVADDRRPLPHRVQARRPDGHRIRGDDRRRNHTDHRHVRPVSVRPYAHLHEGASAMSIVSTLKWHGPAIISRIVSVAKGGKNDAGRWSVTLKISGAVTTV